MSRSSNPEHFFQTDASESTRARKAAKSRNNSGNPIILQSKILTAVPDLFSSTSIYIAESAGCVRKVNIDTKDTSTVYRGPTAPVTSVAIGGPGGATIFAGCWDKDIWSWERESGAVGRRFKGHSDFVKVVICAKIEGKDCLISGGADAKIIVWEATTGERLLTLRDKSDTMMALQDLAIDPQESTTSEVILVSASSDPHIRHWRITLSSWTQVLDTTPTTSAQGNGGRNTIRQHETSVYKVLFQHEDEDAGLWTASADGTAKCLSRAKAWRAEDSYSHGDYVRSVAVTPDWVITAGRDEDIKIWDKSTGKLWHVYEGHYEEVTGLILLDDDKVVVSVSIDGTVRSWSLKKSDLAKARIERKAVKNGEGKDDETVQDKSLLTAEEEAELADLMDSD